MATTTVWNRCRAGYTAARDFLFHESGEQANAWLKNHLPGFQRHCLPRSSASLRNAISPPQELVAYAGDSYPHNHNYQLTEQGLVAGWQLSRRWRQLRPHYPAPLTSLIDLSCSKGFFVLEAALRPECRRALGVDIDPRELAASRAVREFLGAERAEFQRLRLHETAARIAEFGGPFRLALLINCYQYLYFGSDQHPERYLDHREIFRGLRAVCDGTLLFSNRTELGQLQSGPLRVAQATGHTKRYCTEAILSAAEEFFRVTRVGNLDNLPLWEMHARSDIR